MNNMHSDDPGESQKQHEALQHETWYCNSSRVLSVTECTVGACTYNTLVHEVSPEKKGKQETKPITKTELYWWESLVGNGITQAFNWMGLTFAEQGVVAFVSVWRHNLLLYTCIMLHWFRRGSSLPQKRKLTVTLGRLKHTHTLSHFS